MAEETKARRRFIQIGLAVLGITSFVALVAMIATGIEKVHAGHGLDTYRTSWLVEFNWVGFLLSWPFWSRLWAVASCAISSGASSGNFNSVTVGVAMTSNQQFVRSGHHRGPRLAAAIGSAAGRTTGR